jgi:hypothetical protein
MKKYIKLLIPLALSLFSCARQGQPTGGPKDTTPPALDSLRSTPNFATRFVPKRLELKFNEWVTLSDAANQVVVSPPLAKKPEILLRGKTVVVKFDEAEKFRDSTTYTVNFGTAVKDLHEGNPAADLRFVFSTGDFIDSLSHKGRVVDAFTGEGVDNISVMLYDNLLDSVIRKEKPYYFSRTDKTGQFELKNIREGRFKIIAIEDLDQNLKWDGENERLAFMDTLLVLNDSSRAKSNLKLFKNIPKYRITDKSNNGFGAVKIKFSTSADSVILANEPIEGLKTLLEKTQDSITLWYDIDPSVSWKLFASKDTIQIKAHSREDFLKNHVLGFANETAQTGTKKGKQPVLSDPKSIKTIEQNPEKGAVLEFNYPIESLDSIKWRLLVDSTVVGNWSLTLDKNSVRKVLFNMKWVPGVAYHLEILPGAVKDFWGQTNADTLHRKISVPAEKQLGTLSISATDLTVGKTYVLQLLVGDQLVENRPFTAETTTNKLIFNKLLVNTYTARLIEDRNKNGKWDTGNYWQHLPPEPIATKKLDALRGNWELDAKITLLHRNEEKKNKK